MREDPNEVYDRLRCRCCGCAWESYVHPETGLAMPGHNETDPCNRYRPSVPAPPLVGEAIERHGRRRPRRRRPRPRPPTIDDAEEARPEAAGGTPTWECPENMETYDHV